MRTISPDVVGVDKNGGQCPPYITHVYAKYLIECQSRKKSSKSILHKIQHIRARSGKNKFIFVYNRSASPEIIRALIEEGVLVFSYDAFIVFTDRIRTVLNATPPPAVEEIYGGGGWDGVEEQEE